MFNAKLFSKTLKIAKYTYLSGDVVDIKALDQQLEALHVFDLNRLDTESKQLAFWLNVYNGMTNYTIILFQIKESMKELPDLFKRRFFSVSGIDFSLDDVEHGVLRRNARKHLSKDDLRLMHQVDQLDYRIHFALNCGAQSCPAIAYYSEETLEEELNGAMDTFVAQEFIVDTERKIISCSSLFHWYKEDFKDCYLNDPRYIAYKVTLRPYDWSV